jgi:dienelactone hydrolase
VQPAVKVLADASHSYALYLPSKYSTQRLWPLLLAFDPGGDGIDPVELFQPAAEKYGFILVGSNNSRNFADPSTAIRLLWTDILTRYAIDPKRIYATGFSGGSRVAASVAIGCHRCLAGVISCGAGLPAGANLPPAETTEWFLTAGAIDFNHSEITRLADGMDAKHAATHLMFFPGPHSWMPPEVAEQALAWMQLRAMVNGTAPVNKEFVESEFTRQLNAAQSLQKSGDALAAFRAYRGIIHDFRTLRDIKEIQSAQDALAGSGELKHARKAEQAILDLEDQTVSSINDITSAIIGRQKSAGELHQQMALLIREIRHNRDTTSDSARRDALARALFGAFAYARESGSDDMLKKDYLPARDLFMAAAIIRPEAPYPHYLVAQASARLGDGKQALDELGKSVALGLKNPQLLESPEFDKLRSSGTFKDLSARVTQNAAGNHN